MVSPTTGSLMANNKPTFIWEVTDDDSGIAPDTISIKLDSGNVVTSGITKSLIANGYRCTYTPSQALSDGAHTAYFNVTDHDGNTAIQVITAITIDTTPPVLTLSSPVDNLVTNNPSCVVSRYYQRQPVFSCHGKGEWSACFRVRRGQVLNHAYSDGGREHYHGGCYGRCWQDFYGHSNGSSGYRSPCLLGSDDCPEPRGRWRNLYHHRQGD